MKKLKIVSICFIVLYFATEIYFDYNFHPHSGYWLAFQLGLWIIIISIWVIKMRKEANNRWTAFFATCFWVLSSMYFGYHDIVEYKNNVCMDKFGRELNERRQSGGIPVIPTDWHENYRSARAVQWEGKSDVIGHHRKGIVVDACTISYEHDVYGLKPVKGAPRSISIITIYAKGKGRDTISFDYTVDYNTRTITRQQADSIFAAEKIQKDY